MKAADKRLKDRIRHELREAGLRATPARVAVLSVLRGSTMPMTHADVAERLEDHGWDRATVFRNLVALTEVGFAIRTDVGDHVWRFEAVSDASGAEVHEHPHFLCTACGDVRCVPGIEVKLSRGAQVPKSVRSRAVEVQLKGLCDECS